MYPRFVVPEPEPPRDYLREAYLIALGSKRMMPEREHILALLREMGIQTSEAKEFQSRT